MRILIITTQLPYPLTEGANIRTFNLIKQLSKNHEIYLATLIKSKKELDYVQSLQPYCAKIKLVESTRSPFKRLWQIGISPIVFKPYLVKINESDEMEKAVNELAQEVDVVQAEFPYAGQYIEKLKLKKILDEHNVESDILKNQYRYEQSLIRKAFSFLQYRKMLKFEKTLCMKMDIILATSEEDKKILETFNKNVFVVPNGTDVLQDYIEDKGNKIITYIGLMSYRANVDAMLFFSQDIWPLIKNEEPAAKLLIVGKNPTEEIKALAKGDVFVTGEVENVMQYLRDTSVFIAPIRIGSGTRIKILEAMACGKPVVSTRLGCAGLEVQDGNDIFISDGPKQFAQRVLDLMGNKEERIRIGQNALNLVKDRYTWDQIGNKLEKVYQNAI